MTKTVPAALQAHLDTKTTTLAYCWMVARKDGVTQGYTEHDRDIYVPALNLTFDASSGFTASQIEQSLGLSVDNLNVDGAISSDTLNEDDLAAGKYDDAAVTLYWVNWADPTQFIVISTGNIGEVKRQGKYFSAEFRSLSHRLNQKTGRVYQRTCDTVIGSARCGINLSLSTYKGVSTISSVLSTRTLRPAGLFSYVNDWFSRGVLKFTSGPNNGVSYDVKDHFRDTSGNIIIELWIPPAFELQAGWSFEITAGCKQTLDVCHSKFNNVANFQGFPAIPGNDAILFTPKPGGSNQSGGSLGRT